MERDIDHWGNLLIVRVERRVGVDHAFSDLPLSAGALGLGFTDGAGQREREYDANHLKTYFFIKL